MSAKLVVLEKLRKAKNKGITLLDFNAGFAIRSRISELRRTPKIVINTDKIEDFSNGYKRIIARYTLIKE